MLGVLWYILLSLLNLLGIVIIGGLAVLIIGALIEWIIEQIRDIKNKENDL